MTTFDVGLLAGTAVVSVALFLAIMLGAAWLLDKLLAKTFDDYVLALVSFLPAALLLLIITYAGLDNGTPGSVDRTSAKILFGAAMLAAVAGFAHRILSTDEELGDNG